jgi:CubicO group peptidase (beta-lactamase class C family)
MPVASPFTMCPKQAGGYHRMKIVRSLLLFFSPCILLLSCHAQDKPGAAGALDAFIRTKGDSIYKAEKVPGIFIGVLNKGKRSYYQFGYANPSTQTVFDSSTIFEIGSITKTFTAYVLETVLKEKNISDTSFILPYLPDSVRRNTALGNIRFIHLLNHTSGLPRLPANIDIRSKQPYENYTAELLFAFLNTHTPKPPGQFEYSNLAFGLAGVLASSLTHKSYATLLEEYIFQPFHLLKPGDNFETTGKKSQGHFNKDTVAFWKFDALAPAGALKCSGDEVLTYLQTISNPPAAAKPVIDSLLSPTFNLPPGMKVGRGWFIQQNEKQPPVYWHNGGTYGFSTYAAFVKEKDVAVIIAINQFNKNAAADKLGRELIDFLVNRQ